MKQKTILIPVLLFSLLCFGCNDSQQSRRQVLVERFKAAYPDNWEQKLLEYDIEQSRIEGCSLDQSPARDDALGNMIRGVAENLEKNREAERNRQKVDVYLHQR